MSLTTIVQAARDFVGHESSTPPRSYFRPGAIPHADEDPWDGWPEADLSIIRRRLQAQPAERARSEAARKERRRARAGDIALLIATAGLAGAAL